MIAKTYWSDLLLVIDMQNVYTAGQPWACQRIGTALASILRLLESGRFSQVLFTRYLASEQPVGVWKEYNRVNQAIDQNPWMNEIIPALLPWTEKYPLLTKSVYSAFSIPQVRQAAKDARRVVITGVVADCCVLSTVFSAIDAGCPLIYLKDGVAGLTETADLETEHILTGLSPLHLTLMNTEEYLSQASPVQESQGERRHTP